MTEQLQRGQPWRVGSRTHTSPAAIREPLPGRRDRASGNGSLPACEASRSAGIREAVSAAPWVQRAQSHLPPDHPDAGTPTSNMPCFKGLLEYLLTLWKLKYVPGQPLCGRRSKDTREALFNQSPSLRDKSQYFGLESSAPAALLCPGLQGGAGRNSGGPSCTGILQRPHFQLGAHPPGRAATPWGITAALLR